MEQKLNPVTSISEKDRTKIVNTLFQIKVAGYGHTHCGVNKKNLSQRSFFWNCSSMLLVVAGYERLDS